MQTQLTIEQLIQVAELSEKAIKAEMQVVQDEYANEDEIPMTVLHEQADRLKKVWFLGTYIETLKGQRR